VAMMLPQVANAFAVAESDVNVKTPDGMADCYCMSGPFAFRTAAAVPGRVAAVASGRGNTQETEWI
jgi:hypothetical protein